MYPLLNLIENPRFALGNLWIVRAHDSKTLEKNECWLQAHIRLPISLFETYYRRKNTEKHEYVYTFNKTTKTLKLIYNTIYVFLHVISKMSLHWLQTYHKYILHCIIHHDSIVQAWASMLNSNGKLTVSVSSY